ncbi:hypothetical protein Plim_0859 [Planctopirus limnophila DSM 3776]|uniref:Uncharacterized protein n=1 Tax=Planctopirus limnophila (strain ATCC 43296 / DSM 3776 / IFAM 1008 / Mu 290) TaxID=521674 RepID=D5SSF5_PLAL2|nr:hypothetical protein [Planctopirus limnophila]ADG66703.1 hypothetical protein Plim_0859 [Planctopirus limnophila DSM 3776]
MFTPGDFLLAPSLGIDAGQIVGLLVLLFTVLSWVVNAIQGAQKAMAEKQAKEKFRTPPKDNASTKIEEFLREANEKLSGGDQERTQRRAEEARRRQEALQRKTAKEQQKQQKKPKDSTARPQGSSIGGKGLANPSNRPFANTAPSSNPSSFPSSSGALNLNEPVGTANSASMSGTASQTANPSQFGELGMMAGGTAGNQTGNLADPGRMSAATGPHPIIEMLKRPGGAAQAVLINEILSRPRSLR